MNENHVKVISEDKILHVNTGVIVTPELYEKLWTECKNRDYKKFYDQLNEDYNCDIYKAKDFIDNVALKLQICYKHKGSRMLYLHGFVLYAALTNYIKTHPEIKELVIVETGTARGFSSICMGKVLYDNNISGKIYTFDTFPNDKKMWWNCIDDFKGKHTMKELVLPWKEIQEKYLVYVNGRTNVTLPNLLKNVDRVHFSFLDAQHDYPNLKFELDSIKEKQESGDLIVCDDYTFFNNGTPQYPGIQQALDEFIKNKIYEGKIYFGKTDRKNRGYAVLNKK